MTRGKFVVITDDRVFSSFEFNGDMYYDGHGHGPEVIERLGRVNNLEELNKEIRDFNYKNFNYDSSIDSHGIWNAFRGILQRAA